MIHFASLAALGASLLATGNVTREVAPPHHTGELRLSPYSPRIGGTAEERQYYRRAFAKGLNKATFDGRPMMTSIESDTYFFRDFGLAGVTFRWGYWNVSGKARVCLDALGEPIECDEQSEPSATAGTTDTSLTLMPIGVGAVYRFDLLYRDMHIPLIPYAKAGLAYTFWWARADGDVSTTRNAAGEKVKGQGGSWSLEASIGLALNIDWIEPGARGDSDVLAASHIFAEYNAIGHLDMGPDKSPDTSDSLIAFGLALDFH